MLFGSAPDTELCLRSLEVSFGYGSLHQQTTFCLSTQLLLFSNIVLKCCYCAFMFIVYAFLALNCITFLSEDQLLSSLAIIQYPGLNITA